MSAQVLVMDEPSAVLGSSELDQLFGVIRRLRGEGKAVVYVSHRLQEIFRISDRVTVLKDGRIVGTYALDSQLEPSFLVRMMVGKGWSERSPEASAATANELLRVDGLTRNGAFANVSFKVHAGEILGLAGLVGAGRTELCKAIFGASSHDGGRVFLKRHPARIDSPRDAMRHGLAYLSKDRHSESLILSQSVGRNVSLPTLERFTSRGILSAVRENRFVDEMIARTNVVGTGRSQPAAALSGGNQQKVALAKWLGTGARIFLLDDPTTGIDIAAKSQIHHLVAGLAREGAAVVLASSDVSELLALSSRILVMSKGRVTGHLRAQEASEEEILHLATHK